MAFGMLVSFCCLFGLGWFSSILATRSGPSSYLNYWKSWKSDISGRWRRNTTRTSGGGSAVIELSPKFTGLIGLMPLFDLFVLSLYLALTRRFGFALVRRRVQGSFVVSTAVASGAILALGALSCLLFPEVVLQLLDVLYTPIDQWIGVSSSSPESRGFLIGALLGLLMSGPPIFLSFVLGYIHSRFRLEITRRETA
jgi:hypothetical protein